MSKFKDLDEMLMVAGDLAEEQGRPELAALLHGGAGMLPPLPNQSSILGMFRCTKCGAVQMGWYVFNGYTTIPFMGEGWRWARYGVANHGPAFFCPAEACQKVADELGVVDDQAVRDAYSGPWG